MSTTRFTLDGGPELEKRLAEICESVRCAVTGIVPASALEAILLGGGYGRGEGGVLRTAEGEQPYNDLEFYLFLKGSILLNERKWGSRLRHAAEELTQVAGVEIEFKITSLNWLRQTPVTMFTHDLVMGHRWVVGGEELIEGCDHHRASHRIPLSESIRLLMNRCSGLLFCRRLFHKGELIPEDSDFIGRNLAKAQLAFGDVVLASNAQYHWSCRERHRRFKKLDLEAGDSFLHELVSLHRDGVEFKLHPVRTQARREDLLAQHEKISGLGLKLWFWLETRRLNRTFSSPRDYALDSSNKCPETQAVRNWLVHLKAFRFEQGATRSALRYPRERLLRSLPLLLWEKEPLSEPLPAFLKQQLFAVNSDVLSLINSYETIWRRFN